MFSQILDGFPQIFKPEVLERFIFYGMPDTFRTEQHRFKLTSAQMPVVLLILCLLPFSILLQEVCDLLWH